MDVLIVVIISQYVCILNHHVLYFKYVHFFIFQLYLKKAGGKYPNKYILHFMSQIWICRTMSQIKQIFPIIFVSTHEKLVKIGKKSCLGTSEIF